MNIALIGSGKMGRMLESLCKQLYNLPDIDDTGLKQSRIMSLKYLQIKTIKLQRESSGEQ